MSSGLIKSELDFLTTTWTYSGCDLWEEVRSADFFWNRMAYYKAFTKGAAFATAMGDTTRAATYASAASAVYATLPNHWSTDHIIESTSRPIDSSVIIAFNDGYVEGDELFNPVSEYVVGTISTLNTAFCNAYTINTADTANGIAGVLLGRYDTTRSLFLFCIDCLFQLHACYMHALLSCLVSLVLVFASSAHSLFRASFSSSPPSVLHLHLSHSHYHFSMVSPLLISACAGFPIVSLSRYPGDLYFGGNPYPLLSASLARPVTPTKDALRFLMFRCIPLSHPHSSSVSSFPVLSPFHFITDIPEMCMQAATLGPCSPLVSPS